MAEHYTSDRVEITPGLEVMTNEARWGVIDHAQFTSGRSTDPGSKLFDGWFQVNYGDGSHTFMNGERLRTTPIPGLR